MKLAAAVLLVACSRHPALTSCDDSLAGVWHTDAGDWMILDYGATLEGYPLFVDRFPAPPEQTVAPRFLALERDTAVSGDLGRRYMLGSDACVAKAPVHVTACSGNTLELVLGDPLPPVGFAPCSWAGPAPSRRERWVRE